jgi:hypothetical protein
VELYLHSEISNLYQDIDLVTDVKIRTLEWPGHLVGMENNIIAKIALDVKPGRKREVGKPKFRWLCEIQAALKIIGIKEWKRKVQDRSAWMDVMREAEVKMRGPNAIEEEDTSTTNPPPPPQH